MLAHTDKADLQGDADRAFGMQQNVLHLPSTDGPGP